MAKSQEFIRSKKYFYARQVKLGVLTWADVPPRYRGVSKEIRREIARTLPPPPAMPQRRNHRFSSEGHCQRCEILLISKHAYGGNATHCGPCLKLVMKKEGRKSVPPKDHEPPRNER